MMTGKDNMMIRGFATIAALTACLAEGSGSFALDRKPYAESEKVQVRSSTSPCSQRLPLVRQASFDPSLPAEEALESAMEAQRFLGVEENVEIVPPEGAEGGFLRVRYPEDSVNFGSSKEGLPLGGASFYVPFSAGKESCVHYRVRFPADFDFVKGGKLPGLYAGEAPSGGEKVSGKNGWSVRLMWRENGDGELYEYIFNKKGKFGFSAGRGAFSFPRGRWVEIDLEVVVNDPDRRNGVARLWIDGRAVIEQHDIVYTTDDDGETEGGLMFSTFFGGDDDSWASPKDQHVDFGDFRLHAGEPAR